MKESYKKAVKLPAASTVFKVLVSLCLGVLVLALLVYTGELRAPFSSESLSGNSAFNDLFFAAATLLAAFALALCAMLKSFRVKVANCLRGLYHPVELLSSFIKAHVSLVLVIAAVSLLIFGFEVSNFIISLDEERVFPYSLDPGPWAYEGRLGISVFKRLFMVFGMFPPFIANGVAAALLFLSAIFAIALLEQASDAKKALFPIGVFSVIFLSFPSVWIEVLSFSTFSIEVALAMLLTIVSVFYLRQFYECRDRVRLFWGLCFIVIAISIYQAFVTVFLTFSLILAIEDIRNARVSGKDIVKELLIVLLLCGVAVVLYFLLLTLARSVQTNAGSDAYLSAMTGWAAESSPFAALRSSLASLVAFITENNRIPGMKYIGISYVILLVGGLIALFPLNWKKRGALVILLCILGVAPFAMWIALTSTSLPLRTLLALPMLAAYAYYLLLDALLAVSEKHQLDIFYYAACFIALLLAFNQVQIINELFFRESERAQADITMAQSIAEDIEHKIDGRIDRPIVFIGCYDIAKDNDYFYQNPSTNNYWGGDVLGYSLWRRASEPDRMHGLFLMAGYDLEFETPKANESVKPKAVWPEYGSIVEEDSRIVVRLS